MGERDALKFNLMVQKKKRQYYHRYLILPSGNELLKLFENVKKPEPQNSAKISYIPTSTSLQQKWAMVTKSSEDKQFRHQMITFSEEKKNSSPNIIKNLKLVTKSIFRHQRCTNW